MYTDQRLYRARALEPLASIGDVLYVLDQSGPIAAVRYQSAFFAVAGIEPVKAVTPHGLLVLWSQGAAAPAGYGTAVGGTALIPEAVTGNIGQSAYVDINNPKILQQAPHQMFHARFTLKTLALTGVKEHDLELQVFNPASAGKYGLYGASPGFFNMVDQFQDPADAVDSPAQNANQTLPATYPSVHPKDSENLSEMFIWEINAPKFRIWNNGPAAITAGVIGIRMWGFRYDLIPLSPNTSWVQRWVYGRTQLAPPSDSRIVVVPTAPYQASGTY